MQRTQKIRLLVQGLFAITPLFGMNVTYAVQTLPEVEVKAEKESAEYLKSKKAQVADTVELLDAFPGVSYYQAGGVSSLPSIWGLNDDRIKILVDGAEYTSACGNHMNSPLSYIPASRVASINVMAGITPVSMGGDSIAGTITVDSARPVFAKDSNSLLYQGTFSTAYRSNSNGFSTSLNASLASENLSLGFTGTTDRGGSYEDGKGNKVRSTQFERNTQTVTFAARGEDQQFTLRLTHQDVPHQGYVNQYMDLVGNKSDSVNANYTRQFAWGDLDTRIYWQQVNHEMGFFSPEKTGTMPMKTDAKDYGYAVKASIPLTDVHLLRIGNEFHKNTLDDFWPPVPGDVMMMGPNTYVNINNGRRDRFGVFAELESRWNQEWTTLLGIRDDYVKTSTGEVQSYGGMMNAVDIAAATAFNAADRSKSDNHIDLTATTKYEPLATESFEFGYARKTRSPSLYERYTWGRGTMAATMTGWFGDANGYVGDPDLKPETANTISASMDLHDANRESWQLKVTPYYTYVQDYIGVTRLSTFNPLMAMGDTKAILQFDNQDAQFYGINVAWKQNLWDNGQFGKGRVNSSLAWTRGERTNGDDLYHIMPLNARVSLEQRIGAWANAIDLQVVDAKTQVDDQRFELKTAGYSLVNLRSSYQWTKVRVDMSVTNLFDRFYYLPLGGVNYANWNANGAVGTMGSVAGIGRSLNVGLTIDF